MVIIACKLVNQLIIGDEAHSVTATMTTIEGNLHTHTPISHYWIKLHTLWIIDVLVNNVLIYTIVVHGAFYPDKITIKIIICWC